jgi:hypothetical protein
VFSVSAVSNHDCNYASSGVQVPVNSPPSGAVALAPSSCGSGSCEHELQEASPRLSQRETPSYDPSAGDHLPAGRQERVTR